MVLKQNTLQRGRANRSIILMTSASSVHHYKQQHPLLCPSCVLLTNPKQARRLEVCAKIVGMPTKKILFWCRKIQEMLRGVQVLQISLYKSLCLVWNLNLIPSGDMTVLKKLFDTYVLHDGLYRKTNNQDNLMLAQDFLLLCSGGRRFE